MISAQHHRVNKRADKADAQRGAKDNTYLDNEFGADWFVIAQRITRMRLVRQLFRFQGDIFIVIGVHAIENAITPRRSPPDVKRKR